MPRFAANLSMMFNELPFLDRFAAAAAQGFRAVEFLFPYDYAADDIASRLHENGLTQALFNLPPGDWGQGERGIACLAGRTSEFRHSVAKALPYAKATGVKRLHLMSGHGSRNDAAALAAYKDAIRYACDEAGPLGVNILIEPINGRDMPGYFLNDFNFAADLIAELQLPNLRLQYDIYHRQIIHGDVMKSLEALMPIIDHVQTASVPRRNEPGTGELDDENIFAHLDSLGYEGFLGCEYRPAGDTVKGLTWFQPFIPRT
jgi:2-dehydrotetronate isomerase